MRYSIYAMYIQLTTMYSTIVCIDKFDKMRENDRVAIHEVGDSCHSIVSCNTQCTLARLQAKQRRYCSVIVPDVSHFQCCNMVIVYFFTMSLFSICNQKYVLA